MKLSNALVSALITLASVASTAHAAMLSVPDSTQLQNWLGQGAVEFTDIYTSVLSSTSLDFHTAVDGKGATFSVMNVTQDGMTKTIGGYNPQSWNSEGAWGTSAGNSLNQTAFLFNLSDAVKYSFNSNSTDNRQTLNTPGAGPYFGGGPDIYISGDMKHGGTALFNYGDPANYLHSVVSGLADGSGGMQNFTVNSLDVYTISAVPEPETYVMLLSGLAIISFVIRRKKINPNLR